MRCLAAVHLYGKQAGDRCLELRYDRAQVRAKDDISGNGALAVDIVAENFRDEPERIVQFLAETDIDRFAAEAGHASNRGGGHVRLYGECDRAAGDGSAPVRDHYVILPGVAQPGITERECGVRPVEDRQIVMVPLINKSEGSRTCDRQARRMILFRGYALRPRGDARPDRNCRIDIDKVDLVIVGRDIPEGRAAVEGQSTILNRDLSPKFGPIRPAIARVVNGGKEPLDVHLEDAIEIVRVP